MRGNTPTLDDLLLSHFFTAPAPGSITLRSNVYRVALDGRQMGTVTACDRSDAREAAAERWGGDADGYSVGYLHTIVESFGVAEEVDDAA